MRGNEVGELNGDVDVVSLLCQALSLFWQHLGWFATAVSTVHSMYWEHCNWRAR